MTEILLKGRKTLTHPSFRLIRWAYSIGRLCRQYVGMYVCMYVCVYVNIFKHLLRNHWPIEAKFHVEPPWDGGTKVCPNRPGHMTKMATMHIYGKNLEKNFFSRTKRPMTLKLGIQHRVLEYYQVLSNDDPGLTLSYFTARSNLIPYVFVWEKGKTMDFSETIGIYDLKLATDDRSDKKFLLTSKLCPLEAVYPCPEAIYMYVLNHEKNCIKLDFKEISLKLVTNG